VYDKGGNVKGLCETPYRLTARPAEGRYVSYDLAELWNKETATYKSYNSLNFIECRIEVLNSKT
jgi:hypothetical protein